MPIKFELCTVNTVNLPDINDVTYSIGTLAQELTFTDFLSEEADECNLVWTYRAELANGDSLPSDMITFHSNNRTFIVEASLLT